MKLIHVIVGVGEVVTKDLDSGLKIAGIPSNHLGINF